MRLAIGLSFLFLSLTVYRLVAQPPRPPAPPAPPARGGLWGPSRPHPQQAQQQVPPVVMVRHDFEGYGETVEDAQRHALEQARDWMAENVHLGWVPEKDRMEELCERGLVTFGPPSEIKLDKSGLMKVVKAQLQISQQQADEIQKKVLKHRSQERTVILARVLLGLVGLLLVVGGYLRLEEATRGYYTTALRATAIGLVLLLVLGVCVIA